MSGPIARIVEAVVPARLGRDFRWLFGAYVVTNVGDGIALAAGPLLVASLTRDPFLVSLAILAGYLPHLVFGLLAGAVADRHDRRRIVAGVNLFRSLVLVVLTAALVRGFADIAIVLVALFVLGIAETFADAASSTLIPSLVAREDLGVANARQQGAVVLLNQLVTPPIGAFLFVVGMALPFGVNAAGFALGAILVSRIVQSTRSERTAGPSHIRREIAEGVRWLVHHPPMRTLALTIFLFNVTYGAGWSVLVLYAGERLGMDEVGFGLMATSVAIGGVIGTVAYGALERRFALADLLRVGLIIETATHLVLAVTTMPQVALAALVVFGAHAFVWGTLSTVVRQRAVPNALLGRVGSVYRIAIMGGIVVGTPIGGVLARQFGISAPFWFGFVGSALLVGVLWRELAHIAHAGEGGPADRVDPAGTRQSVP